MNDILVLSKLLHDKNEHFEILKLVDQEGRKIEIFGLR